MLAKNVLGILILILNIAGLGYVFYMVCISLINSYFPKKLPGNEMVPPAPVDKKAQVVIDEDIIPEEEDLLKDMDLSDLDHLDLDDFE